MNESKTITSTAIFAVGEMVHHKLFDYRGVIIDVDPQFQLTEEWYQTMARSRPPKDQPWYHVLVNNAMHQTYVAERNLETDQSKDEIRNPLLVEHFSHFSNGRYVNDNNVN